MRQEPRWRRPSPARPPPRRLPAHRPELRTSKPSTPSGQPPWRARPSPAPRLPRWSLPWRRRSPRPWGPRAPRRRSRMSRRSWWVPARSSRSRSCRHLDRLAAVAADAHPAAVLEDGVPDAGRLLAVRADEHDLADVERLREVEDAALLNLRDAIARALALAGLGVALGNVDPVDDDRDRSRGRGLPEAGPDLGLALGLAARRDALLGRRVRQHLVDHALLARVLAGQHHDGVALPDLGHARVAEGHHSTSGASDTIFM